MSDATDPTIEDRIRAWLREHGYPLEYAAAARLQAAGFRAWMGLTYPSGEAVRDIDVVAATKTTAAIELIVECKSGGDPWIVLTRPEQATMAIRPEWLIGRPKDALDPWLKLPEIAGALRLPGHDGFKLIRAFKGPGAPDVGYAALSAAVDAATGRAKQFKGADRLILFPVVVVDGPLFTVRLTPGGDDVRQVDSHRLLWNGSQGRATPIVVDVVTIDYLESYGTAMARLLSDFSSESK